MLNIWDWHESNLSWSCPEAPSSKSRLSTAAVFSQKLSKPLISSHQDWVAVCGSFIYERKWVLWGKTYFYRQFINNCIADLIQLCRKSKKQPSSLQGLCLKTRLDDSFTQSKYLSWTQVLHIGRRYRAPPATRSIIKRYFILSSVILLNIYPFIISFSDCFHDVYLVFTVTVALHYNSIISCI